MGLCLGGPKSFLPKWPHGSRYLACFSQQTPAVKSAPLFCDYFTNGSPALTLLPAKREVLSLRPLVVLFHGFVTDDVARRVKDLARTRVSARSRPSVGASN